jgi:hypothetical protein
MTTLAPPPAEVEPPTVVGGRRPDITVAQILSVIPVIAGLLAAFDVYEVNDEEAEALKFAILWGIALIFGDAGLRAARNFSTARRDVAAIYTASDPTAPPTIPPKSLR